MTDFARGTLLGRHLFVTAGSVTTLFTAAITTEVMLILSPSSSPGGDPILNLYHLVAGDAVVFDLSTAITWERALSAADDAVLFAAQTPGSGIHLGVGDSIAAEVLAGTPASEVNVSIYGVTATLQAVR